MSGNVSNHVWVEDATKPLGGYWKRAKGTIYGTTMVSTLPEGLQRIREKIALDGTAVTLDWSATPIKAVMIRVTADTAGTANLGDSVVITIDPPNSTVRDAWLTEGTSLTADSYRIPIPVNGEIILSFTSSVSYIGVKRDDGTGTMRVFAIGVEA